MEKNKEFHNSLPSSHYKAKFTCSYGGDIHSRHHDNHLSYVGGHTKILYVDRTISFAAMLATLSALSPASYGCVSFKYQLPGDDDLDALISVTDDNDLQNMMLEYDHLHRDSPTRARMRLFLFPPNNNPPSDTFIGPLNSGSDSGAVVPKSEYQSRSAVNTSGEVAGSESNANHQLEVQRQFRFGVDVASSSSNSRLNGPLTPREYDVFISFRGEDTRTKFTCHLHDALCRNQVKTFIDYELHKGDEISPSLYRAIENSYVSVVVFSENYASSKWCLNELVRIMECREEHGQVVLPVFYDIDPSHVRKQHGSYKEAFENHEQNPMLGTEKIQQWKNVLSEAADLAGWDSHSRSYRDDYELIQKIVKDVLQKLDHRYPPDSFKSLVGIGKNSAPLESLLRDSQSVGIWGIGGIGKTTIARYIFDKYSPQYEGSCFLESVRERSGEHGKGLCELRNLLYSNLLKDRIQQTSTEKNTFVEHRLRRQRNFVVLDDVSSSKQVEYLVGELQSYDARSRIIITTRDRSLLQNRRVEKIYELGGLDFQESLTLFSMNAFNEGCPQIEYKELSERAVSYCQGVPLALIVLGSFLHSKSETEWDCMLEKLERIPNEEIQNVLRLSYDGLNHEEKQIFLDIACFFKGMLEERVVELLDKCGFYAVIGMRSLRDKALITKRSDYVWMHDLIQEMGWEIVRQESIQNPGNRSRLWNSDDICDVLKNNKGTDSIQGIMLDLSKCEQDLCLSADTFKKMSELRFLKIFASKSTNKRDLQLPMGLDSFSNKLRYLEWHSYPSQSLPSDFCPEKLVTLRLCLSQLERLWGGIQNLVNLKELNLGECHKLIELPDFSKARNLRKVYLYKCENLLHVHPSILSLDTLEEIDLYNCLKLETLESENHCRSLWNLHTTGCSSLMKLSISSEEMKFLYLSRVGGVEGLQASMERLSKLVNLYIVNCRFKNLPKDLSCLKSIEKLSITGCERGVISKQNLHVMFNGLQSLRELNLKGCDELFELPNNLSHLSSLEKLVLDGSQVERLPQSIKHLSRLDTLSLQNCWRLHSLPELPSSITCFDALNCASLWTISSSSLMNSVPQEQECKSISDHAVSLEEEKCIYTFHQYLRETAYGYALRRREGMNAKFWQSSFSICYPGCRVPEWFTYRTKGSSITFELAQPSNHYSSFLLCIVLSTYCTSEMYSGLYIQYRCFGDGNMQKYSTGSFFLDDTFEKRYFDHVYMSFDGIEILKTIKENRVNDQNNSYNCNMKVTLDFYGVCGVDKWKPNKYLLIRECGVYPILGPTCCSKQMELEVGMNDIIGIAHDLIPQKNSRNFAKRWEVNDNVHLSKVQEYQESDKPTEQKYCWDFQG